MKSKQYIAIFFTIIFVNIFFQNCTQPKTEKKKIVYVNSYHRGHPSSDEIMDAIIEEFPSNRFDLHTYIMDTKRNTSQEYIEDMAAQLVDSISLIKPDIVIVSDDNAVKYLIQPYFGDMNLPVVFCGVNWSDKEYNLEAVKVTGMLEILPLAEVLLTMKSRYPSMKKLLVLNENTTTSRKEKLLLDSLFNRVGVVATHELVNDFDSWKTKFKEGNKEYDIIYISTNGAIKNWDKNQAVNFVHQHISIPVITCEDFMMPYAVLGMTKVAREQGLWAAETAKRILNGENPSDIPVTRNKESAVWINSSLAEKIGFNLDKELLKQAKIVTK
ncbi:hypothetical protein N9164_02790 [Draconibacterium sp.]|nr:hypothetical protein [Draconibacterium sp.]